LASVSIDDKLSELSSSLNHGFRELKLIELLAKNRVPMQRATWFIRIHQLSTSGAGGGGNASRQTPTQAWSKTLTAALRDCCLAKPTMRVGPGDGGGDAQRTLADYVARLLAWHAAERLLDLPELLRWFTNELCHVPSSQPRRLSLLGFLLHPLLQVVLCCYSSTWSSLSAPTTTSTTTTTTSSSLIAGLRALSLAIADRATTLPCLAPIWFLTSLCIAGNDIRQLPTCKSMIRHFLQLC
jgi:hypothetical protein